MNCSSWHFRKYCCVLDISRQLCNFSTNVFFNVRVNPSMSLPQRVYMRSVGSRGPENDINLILKRWTSNKVISLAWPFACSFGFKCYYSCPTPPLQERWNRPGGSRKPRRTGSAACPRHHPLLSSSTHPGGPQGQWTCAGPSLARCGGMGSLSEKHMGTGDRLPPAETEQRWLAVSLFLSIGLGSSRFLTILLVRGTAPCGFITTFTGGFWISLSSQ